MYFEPSLYFTVCCIKNRSDCRRTSCLSSCGLTRKRPMYDSCSYCGHCHTVALRFHQSTLQHTLSSCSSQRKQCTSSVATSVNLTGLSSLHLLVSQQAFNISPSGDRCCADSSQTPLNDVQAELGFAKLSTNVSLLLLYSPLLSPHSFLAFFCSL
jgi:hypothetical protein